MVFCLGIRFVLIFAGRGLMYMGDEGARQRPFIAIMNNYAHQLNITN